MDFWCFLASSYEGAYLSYVTEQGYVKTPKRRELRRKSCFDQTNSFFRLFVFCSFAPSPHEYTVSRGVPNSKKSEFWWIFDVSFGVLKILVYLLYTDFRVLEKTQKGAKCVANLALTKQTLFFVCLSFACVLLLPTGTQYPAGSPDLCLAIT